MLVLCGRQIMNLTAEIQQSFQCMPSILGLGIDECHPAPVPLPGVGGSKAPRLSGWLAYVAEKVLGKNDGFGHRVTPVPSGLHCRHSRLTDRACSSPTLFAEDMARRKAVFNDTHFNAELPRGSNGCWHSAFST